MFQSTVALIQLLEYRNSMVLQYKSVTDSMTKEEEKTCRRLRRSVFIFVMEGRYPKSMAMPLHFTGRLAK